jgi:Tol biopolymer transport system component
MVMDAGGGDARSLLDDVVLAGTSCDWSPDGRSILTSAPGTLSVVNPDGASAPLVGDGIDGFAMGGVWFLDGSHILFSMRLEGEEWNVYTTEADGSDLTRITDFDLLEEAAAWLP